MTSLYKTENIEITNPLADHPTLYLMHLHHGVENRFTLDFVHEIGAALDFVEDAFINSKTDGGALITTGAGKFYSNGLAIEAAMKQGEAFYLPYMKLLARLLAFRLPTVAAINGHAMAGGCMFAFAHDYRIMRADRGWIAMNEVDLGIPLIPGMAAIVKCRIKSTNDLRQCVLAGHRFKASDAVAAGFVDRAVEADKVVEVAVETALAVAPKAKGDAGFYKMFKEELYKETIIELISGGIIPGAYLSKL